MKIKKEENGAYSIPVDLNWADLMMILCMSTDFRKNDKGSNRPIDEVIEKTRASLIMLEDELKKIDKEEK